MKYEPRLDDYVSWRNVEGWVYYIDDEHLTIEIGVRPKEDDLVPRTRNITAWLLFRSTNMMNLYM